MNLKRNGVAITALVLSTAVFVTTALADTLIGSGYNSLKDSVKSTAAQMEKGLDSFTLEGIFVMKDNGEKLMESSVLNKVDNILKASENSNTETYVSGKTSTNYTYRDENVNISKHTGDEQEKYYLREVSPEERKGNRAAFSNPFNEEHFSDVEKIFDAAIGSLKDNVQVEDTSDGGKMYSGTITETQVPALINAVASFGLKQITSSNSGDQRYRMPVLKSDIYIKQVSGKVLVNQAGQVYSVSGEMAFGGLDDKGAPHDITIELYGSIKDIGTTIVQKPDLEGKNVEKISKGGNYFGSRYVGNYKNNIIIEENSQFVKIGERQLSITQADDSVVAGTYSETYKPGYESYAAEALNFSFTMNLGDNMSQAQFTYQNAAGETEYGQIHPAGNGKVYLSIHQELVEIRADGGTSIRSIDGSMGDYDSEFTRVFE